MKKERGAITLFVLLAMMFFVMALVSLFLVASSRAKLEKQITGQIQDSYQEDANTVYNSYFGGEVVPIYTAEQLLKIGTGEKIRINEENGKIYTFSKDATYVLKNNLEFSETEMGLTESWYPIGNQIEDKIITGRFEGNYMEIKVTDLQGRITVYNRQNEYKKVQTNIPVPDGYVISQITTEDEEAEGLVIYEIPEGATVNWQEDEADGTNESTITIGGSTTNLQETVNQYVWIPVDINDMVMCRSNSGTSVCDLLYDEDENTLTCQTHPATATDLVGRLYTSSRTGSNPYSYIMDFAKRDQTYSANSGNREPAIVTGNNSGDGTSYDGDSSNLEIAGMPAGSTAEQFLTQLKNDFTVMAKSVAKNGGFYISRYEVGEGGNSKKGQAVLTAGSSDGSNYLGANKWYGLYNTIRKIDENKQMIWGCQYDQVIKFLKENGEDPENGHSDRNLITDYALSGQNEQDCMKNIYDLEGNYEEWTAEAYSTDLRAYRGSYYGDVLGGNFYPASDRGGDDPTDSGSYNSSRSTLYL